MVERCKGNSDALTPLKMADEKLEAHISYITVAEFMDVISREYGERETRVQYAYLKHSPLIKDGKGEEIARNAGLYKTKYRFSLAGAIILAAAVEIDAEVPVTGGDKHCEEELKETTEVEAARPAAY